MGKTQKQQQSTEHKGRHARLGLTVRISKIDKTIRSRAPKGKQVSLKTPIHVAAVLDKYCRELFKNIAEHTENGKHQVTPCIIASVVGDKNWEYYGFFDTTVGGIYPVEKKHIVRRRNKKKNKEQQEK